MRDCWWGMFSDSQQVRALQECKVCLIFVDKRREPSLLFFPLLTSTCLLTPVLLPYCALFLLIFLLVSSPTLPYLTLSPFLSSRYMSECAHRLCPPCYIISYWWCSVIKHRIMPQRVGWPWDVRHDAVITRCNYICLTEKVITWLWQPDITSHIMYALVKEDGWRRRNFCSFIKSYCKCWFKLLKIIDWLSEIFRILWMHIALICILIVKEYLCLILGGLTLWCPEASGPYVSSCCT